MEPYYHYLDSDDEDDRPLVYKRPRSRLPPTTADIVNTLAANVPAAAVQENDAVGELDPREDDDDMGVDEEYNPYDGGEGSDYAYREEEEGELVGYQNYPADEGRDEVDDRNQGQSSRGGDMVTNDVDSGNSVGFLGTKSSMLGTFTDPDVLDCPICCDTLTIPVFQCENGHIACSFCCIKIENKCPSCSLRIGYIRCRSIERILNSVKFSCQNLEYGCKETILHSKREVHEKACIFAPCYCPVEGCYFVGSTENLYAHFRGRHLRYVVQFDYKRPFNFWLESRSKKVILQEKTDGTIFILNQSSNYVPRAINLIRMGALHSREEFCYELSVEYEDSKLKLKSVSATVPKWSASHRLKNYLLVPTDFADPNGSIDVGVCIDKRRRR